MSSSGNVFKRNFIQMSGDNTRVIDTNALVAKRMEGFSGILREKSEDDFLNESDGADYDADALDMLSTDADVTADSENGKVTGNDSSLEGDTLSADSVRAECEEMIAKANAKAEEIREQARIDAKEIEAKGYEEGFNKGKEEALQQALIAKRQFDEMQVKLRTEYDELVKTLEPKMVDVITQVYEHVFGSNFFSRRDVMVCLINKALMSIETDEKVTIQVSPSDYDMLIGMKSALFEKVSLQNTPEIVQKENFVKGQAKIETPYGVIDCSIDTELKELTRTLRLLSYEGNDRV